jgi:rod shape-determining protein MreD
MKIFIFFIFTIVLILLQTTLFSGIRILGVSPDLTFIIILLASFYLESDSALFISILAGFLKDTLSVEQNACYSVLLPLCCLGIMRLKKEIILDAKFLSCLFLFIFILAFDILTKPFIFNSLLAGTNFIHILRIGFIEASYTAIVFYIINKYAKKLI